MSAVIRVQRACNGCDRLFREATGAEFELVISDMPLPDVRDECEHCSGTIRGEGLSNG